MGRLVVINGAVLVCNGCPGTPSTLTVTGNLLTPTAMGQPVATIKDHEPGGNIIPFSEICKFTHKSCNPKTPDPWTPGESSVFLPSMVPLISELASLSCDEGGTIEILYAGQSEFSADMPLDFEAIYEDGVLIGYVSAAKGNEFYYYDADGRFLERFVDDALKDDPIHYDAALLLAGPEVKVGRWLGRRLFGIGAKKVAGRALRRIPAYITSRLRQRAAMRRTTAHGAERIAGRGATRGGVLARKEIKAVRKSGTKMRQADGAMVRVLQVGEGRFNVVVEGERGIITTFRRIKQKRLERLARNYKWTPE